MVTQPASSIGAKVADLKGATVEFKNIFKLKSMLQSIQLSWQLIFGSYMIGTR